MTGESINNDWGVIFRGESFYGITPVYLII